jgi:DNA mismatch repair protein MutL
VSTLVPPARAPIRRLAPATVERIAAGEVVERPASVVKELVENAYDAGAATVSIRLREGGLRRIEVADDGAGIPADELALAVERHATSKLAPDGPIEAIGSLGFRGEALGAIAAVSRLRLVSRPSGAEAAEGIEVVGGRIAGRFAEGRAVGTTVSVDDLFFNTPARRKFVGTPAREQVEVVRTVESLYLARPQVTVRLSNETGEIASLPATRSLADAAARVLGPEFARSAFPVTATAPVVRIDGVLGAPGAAGPTSTALHVAINGRPVVARPIASAVRVAFGETIPRSRFPVGVLHLEVDPTRVDVNVHPTKREVRLASARDVEAELRRAVREALDRTTIAAEPPVAADARVAAAWSSAVARRPRRAVGPAAVARAAQATLSVGPVPLERRVVAPSAGRPGLVLLGAIDAVYWVARADDGIVLVDQHAASERVLYATVLDGGAVARQTLVEPIPLELAALERAGLEAHADEVRAAGFEVERFGPATYRVLAVPTYRGRTVSARAVADLLRELADGGRPTVPDGFAERRAASIACHAAIRAGDVVEPGTIAELLGALDRLPDRPRSCPHGRPIVVRLSRARLDRWFLRSGA